MPNPNEDPALTNARREAIIATVACVIAMVYTVTYCSLFGYHRTVESVRFVWGFPDWVFWGVVLPWAVCVLFGWLFGAFFIRDDDLGEDLEGSEDEDFFVKESGHAG